MGKSFVYNTGCGEDLLRVENIELICVFFGGTVNNLRNNRR